MRLGLWPAAREVLLGGGAAFVDRHFIVGVVPGGDGTNPTTGRQGKTGETVIAQAHGKYYEDASRGTSFFASDIGAGVVVPVTLSTAAIISLANPLASGKRLALQFVSLAYFTGTMPSGALYHCFSNTGDALPSAGTLQTAYVSDIGNQAAVAAVGVVRTAPTVVAPVKLFPWASSFAELATTANGFQMVWSDLDGQFVLEPGFSYQLQCVAGAVGASPKASVGISWSEIPIVATQG